MYYVLGVSSFPHHALRTNARDEAAEYLCGQVMIRYHPE